MATTFITLGKIKRRLNLSLGDVSNDILLEELEAEAIALISSPGWCNQDFSRVVGERHIVDWVGRAGYSLWLPYSLVEDVTAVETRVTGTQDPWTEVSGDYALRSKGNHWTLEYEGSFTHGSSYRVTFTKGYAHGSLPSTVESVLLSLITWSYKERRDERFGLTNQGTTIESGGAVSTRFTTWKDFERNMKSQLSGHRMRVI